MEGQGKQLEATSVNSEIPIPRESEEVPAGRSSKRKITADDFPAPLSTFKQAMFRARFSALKKLKARKENRNRTKPYYTSLGPRLKTIVLEFKSTVSEFPDFAPECLAPWIEDLVQYIRASSKDYKHIRMSDVENWIASHMWITAPLLNPALPQINEASSTVVSSSGIADGTEIANISQIDPTTEETVTGGVPNGSAENMAEQNPISKILFQEKANTISEDGPTAAGKPGIGDATHGTAQSTAEAAPIPKTLFLGKLNLQELSLVDLQTLMKEAFGILGKRAENNQLEIQALEQEAADGKPNQSGCASSNRDWLSKKRALLNAYQIGLKLGETLAFGVRDEEAPLSSSSEET